jgi:hypothetical protein
VENLRNDTGEIGRLAECIENSLCGEASLRSVSLRRETDKPIVKEVDGLIDISLPQVRFVCIDQHEFTLAHFVAAVTPQIRSPRSAIRRLPRCRASLLSFCAELPPNLVIRADFFVNVALDAPPIRPLNMRA